MASAACLAWSMAFCTHSSRISVPSRPIWRVQSPAAKIAGSPVMALLVDDDAVLAGKPGFACQFVVRHDADADQHDVGGMSDCRRRARPSTLPLPSKASTPVFSFSFTPAFACSAA